jgi:hypothetical protein
MIRKIVATAFCLSLLGHFPVQGEVYDLAKARAFLNETDVEIRSDWIDKPKPETLAAYREMTGCTDFYVTDDIRRAYICLVVKNLENPNSDPTRRMRNGELPFADFIYSGMTPKQMMNAVRVYRNANPGFRFLFCIDTLDDGRSLRGGATAIIPSKYRQSFCDLCTQIIGTQP